MSNSVRLLTRNNDSVLRIDAVRGIAVRTISNTALAICFSSPMTLFNDTASNDDRYIFDVGFRAPKSSDKSEEQIMAEIAMRIPSDEDLGLIAVDLPQEWASEEGWE